MFIGRTNELESLNKRYSAGKFELAVIYGRRRVGKTTLINEFIKNKEAIYFTGIEGNKNENLEGLSKSVYSLSPDFANTGGSFPDFGSALETVFGIASKRRVVFVIDEYPYLANSHTSISSILQVLIDRNKDSSKLFLILCGSSLSFMEEQVLGSKSPLFGRRTCQYKVLPFGFFEASKFFTKFKGTDMATIYGITGGIPLYLSLMDENISVQENIRMNFLDPNAYLFEEPLNLIKQECRDPREYNSIIKAIAGGASKMSEICTKTGIETPLAANYLGKLVSLNIVKKEVPFGSDNTRKGIYVLEDSMFRFWYRVIPDNIAAINRRLVDLVFEKIDLPAFTGQVFEEICKQYLWEQNRRGKAAFPFTDIGRWWGSDRLRKQEVEIDIMGTNAGDTALFAECKWTNEKVGAAVLDGLVYKSKLFRFKEFHYYLFSKAGFTKECENRARASGNVLLVGFDEIVRGV